MYHLDVCALLSFFDLHKRLLTPLHSGHWFIFSKTDQCTWSDAETWIEWICYTFRQLRFFRNVLLYFTRFVLRHSAVSQFLWAVLTLIYTLSCVTISPWILSDTIATSFLHLLTELHVTPGPDIQSDLFLSCHSPKLVQSGLLSWHLWIFSCSTSHCPWLIFSCYLTWLYWCCDAIGSLEKMLCENWQKRKELLCCVI